MKSKNVQPWHGFSHLAGNIKEDNHVNMKYCTIATGLLNLSFIINSHMWLNENKL